MVLDIFLLYINSTIFTQFNQLFFSCFAIVSKLSDAYAEIKKHFKGFTIFIFFFLQLLTSHNLTFALMQIIYIQVCIFKMGRLFFFFFCPVGNYRSTLQTMGCPIDTALMESTKNTRKTPRRAIMEPSNTPASMPTKDSVSV